MFALVISLLSLLLNFKTIKLAEDANDETKKSSAETKKISDKSIELANQTISYLNSISNSSNSLNKNLTDFSSTLIPLNRSLLELTSTLVSVNKLSNDQLKNLSSINNNIQKQIDDIERKRTEEQLQKSKKPNIVVYVECDFKQSSYKIILKNIGDLIATVKYTYHWEGRDISNTISLTEKEPYLIRPFSESEYMIGDSISVPITISWGSENGSGWFTKGYIKCENMK